MCDKCCTSGFRRQTRPNIFNARKFRDPLIGLILALITSVASYAESPGGSAPSATLFEQMAPVLQGPRCMNCHTMTDYPKQGDDRHRHLMNVSRGPEGMGAAGLHCNTCHQSANQSASGVPGAPDWHLAPLRMAWEGLTVGQLCEAIQDPTRGGMKPKDLVAHFNTGLVRWAWSPGRDARGVPRTTPPISHDAFIGMTKKWISSGAVCPKS